MTTSTRLLTLRVRHHSRFVRRGVHDKKKLSASWRMPKGGHNKMRRQLKAKGALPTPGYGSPAAVRGLHPSGYRDILVFNMASLSGLNPESDAIRIGGTVGMKARAKIQAAALEQGLKVLNPRESGEVAEPVPVPEETAEEVTEDE
ncbi:MAG: 50S ribosomal protein L32e [Methanomicrobiales archaeon]|nr:50S ribosomal protein L32e [Methanomicrobiales archaeon]